MKDIIAKLLLIFPDIVYTKVLHFVKVGKALNLKNPRSFSEKLNYIKTYSNNPLRSLVADRIKVRDYVREKSPTCALIPVVWTGKEITKEIYDNLPQNFVIKANHGSQMVEIVDKDNISFEELRQTTRKWLKRNYYARGRERVYLNLDRFLVVEKKITTRSGGIPQDYKFFCFNGLVEVVQIDTGRFGDHKRNFFNRDFEMVDLTTVYSPGEIEKPSQFNDAVRIAEELSHEFSFIRVDLFLTDDGKVYFGELTNFPANGMRKYKPEEYEDYFGRLITDLY